MFLCMGRSLKFIVKEIVFDGLEVCMRKRKRYPQNIKSETNIHPKIHEQSIQFSCSKKGHPKDGKSSNNRSKDGLNNEKKLVKTHAPKR